MNERLRFDDDLMMITITFWGYHEHQGEAWKIPEQQLQMRDDSRAYLPQRGSSGDEHRDESASISHQAPLFCSEGTPTWRVLPSQHRSDQANRLFLRRGWSARRPPWLGSPSPCASLASLFPSSSIWFRFCCVIGWEKREVCGFEIDLGKEKGEYNPNPEGGENPNGEEKRKRVWGWER